MTISVGFTRPPERMMDADASVRKMGMVPYGAPSLMSVPARPEVFNKIRNVLHSGNAYFTIFASISAVEAMAGFFGKDTLLTLLENTNVACTGPSTEAALRIKTGRGADLVPEIYSGVGIAMKIKDEVEGKTVVILRSAEGDPGITNALAEAGADVMDEAVYTMQPAPFSKAHKELLDTLSDGAIDAMLFTSPRSFELFLEQSEKWLGRDKAHTALDKVCKVSIGGPTSAAIERNGFKTDILPKKSTFEGMLDAVAEHFS